MDYVNIAGNECVVVDETCRKRTYKVVEIKIEVEVEECNLESFAEELTTVVESYRV